MKPLIPIALRANLSRHLSTIYTHEQIIARFEEIGLYAHPFDLPHSSQTELTRALIVRLNAEKSDPLKAIGPIIEEALLDIPTHTSSYKKTIEDAQQAIKTTLEKLGFELRADGLVNKASLASVKSLKEIISSLGSSAITQEVDRAAEKISTDAAAAAHYAGNILEATCKVYLEKSKVEFEARDTLRTLWKKVSENLKLAKHAQDNSDPDIQNLATALIQVVDILGRVRNKKSAAHGKSNQEKRALNLQPKHAKLAVGAASTLATYLLDSLE